MRITARVRSQMTRKSGTWKKLANRIDVDTGHAVRTWAANVQRMSKAQAPVDTGYLRESIYSTRLGPKRWKVSVGATYGVYVEYGTRHMAAQPYFLPSIKEADKILIRQIARSINGRP